MAKRYVLIVVVIIVILGLVGVFWNQGGPRQAQAPSSNSPNPAVGPQAGVETPTGNIDDVVSAISSDIASDNTPTIDSDPAALSENDQALSDVGQALGAQFQ